MATSFILCTCMWSAEHPFYSGEIYCSQHTIIQTLPKNIYLQVYSVANGLVARYLLVVTLWGQPGSHQATYIHRGYNPNNSCDYYKCVSKVGHSLAVTSSYLPTKQSSSAHITHLLSIGDPISRWRGDERKLVINRYVWFKYIHIAKINKVLCNMYADRQRVLCRSGANAAQVSRVWWKTTSLNT